MAIHAREIDDGVDLVLDRDGSPFLPIGWKARNGSSQSGHRSKTHLMQHRAKRCALRSANPAQNAGCPDYLERRRVPALRKAQFRLLTVNPEHKRGGSKAKLLISLGYFTADFQRLEFDLRANT